jgi:D-alanyl-D-alanine carboxypeptidase
MNFNMNEILSKFLNYKKWLLVPVALAFLALLIFALSPHGNNSPINKPAVLGSETITPLGIPSESERLAPPRLDGTMSLEAIKAKSFLVYDINSGAVLAARESNQPVAIASVTKLMTGLVAYRTMPSFKQNIIITGKDLFAVEPSLGLKSGDHVAIGDLFYAMLVGSANDAALTLANHVEAETAENFVTLMNRTAESLGMANSHFSNPLGFDSEANYSTANDLRKLIEEVQKYQAFNLVGRNQSYSFAGTLGIQYSVKATNQLIKENKELYAIKTGYTNLAQGAMITESRDQAHPFVIIVLDSPNREDDTLNLRSQILKNYSWDASL